MEHIVQFGITIDDDVIKKNIEKNVQNQVVDMIKKDCIRELVGNEKVSNWEYTGKIKTLIVDTTNDFLELHKTEIIEATAIKLVERLSKTKAVKDMVSSTIEELMKK